MKKIYLYIILTAILVSTQPYSVHAATQCDLTNTTVVYINGIFGDETSTKRDSKSLEVKIGDISPSVSQRIQFTTAYNPSHLAGLGDLIKSIEQSRANDGIVKDFDLQEILKKIHTEVHTQKIILVGHSQGTFYTNAVYAYLTKHGIPPTAITILNVATPASVVEGEGKYITSDTDKVINKVRVGIKQFGGNLPLPANRSFTLTEKEQQGEFAGHSFSDIYLQYAGVDIAKDIALSTKKLKSTPVPQTVTDGCFNVNPTTLIHKAEAVTFAVADPVSVIGKQSVVIPTKIAFAPLYTLDKYVLNPIGTALGRALQKRRSRRHNTTRTNPAPKKTAQNQTPQHTNAPQNKPTAVHPPQQSRHTTAPNLSKLQAQLNEASAILALLQLQVKELKKKKEAECIKNSIRGPWDNPGWIGGKPGCNDPTPWIQKMFFAPIQGAGGEAVNNGPPPGPLPPGLGSM